LKPENRCSNFSGFKFPISSLLSRVPKPAAAAQSFVQLFDNLQLDALDAGDYHLRDAVAARDLEIFAA